MKLLAASVLLNLLNYATDLNMVSTIHYVYRKTAHPCKAMASLLVEHISKNMLPELC